MCFHDDALNIIGNEKPNNNYKNQLNFLVLQETIIYANCNTLVRSKPGNSTSRYLQEGEYNLYRIYKFRCAKEYKTKNSWYENKIFQ